MQRFAGAVCLYFATKNDIITNPLTVGVAFVLG